MAINADFPMLSYDEANPMIKALQSGREQMRQSLEFPKELIAKELANKQNELMNQIYGVQAKYAEPMTQEELQKAKQMNAYQGLVNQFYGPNMQSEMGLRGAQAENYRQNALTDAFKRNNPLLLGDDTKNAGALLADPRFRPLVQQYLNSVQQGNQQPGQMPPLTAPETNQQKFISSILGNTSEQKQSPLTSFDRATAPIKNAMIAQARAFGLDDSQAYDYLRSGKKLSDIAEMQGYTRDGADWPNAIYNPTTATQTQQQRANIAQAGIKSIEPDISKDLAPYAKKWNGTSLTQLYDSLKGNSDEKIGKAIGAAAMAQELAMLRLRSGGANVGIGALRETLDASKTRLNVPDLSMTPKQFELAQDYIGQHISKLNEAENKALYPQGKAKSAANIPKISDEKIQELATRKGKSPEEIKRLLEEKGLL